MSAAFDPRITAYFGDAVMQAGFMPLPHLFLRHYRQLGMSHVQAMFTLQLMEIAWDVGRPPSSVSKLAERMGVGHRTIQICSKELHALELIDVYDQFDDGGAQVENGYDLSPLFRRLAEFAPSERPAGECRERRPRARPARDDADQVDVSPVEPYTTPVQIFTPAPRSYDHRPGVESCAPPVIVAAGLIEETKKQIKKQTKNKQHAAVVDSKDQPAPDTRIAGQPGYSVRWNIPLSVDEVTASQDVLRQIGLNALVVDACALSMHPGECWALWCYARGANLGVAWMASQMFDFRERRAQPTSQAQAFDHIGKRLAALPMDEARALLEHVNIMMGAGADKQAQLWKNHSFAAVPHQELLTALHDAYSEQQTKRLGRAVSQLSGQNRVAINPTIRVDETAGASDDPVWSTVRIRLEQQTEKREFATWLGALVLLELHDGRAYIGAPNVFVRDEVMARYSDLIARALQEVVAEPVEIVLVIGSSCDVSQN